VAAQRWPRLLWRVTQSGAFHSGREFNPTLAGQSPRTFAVSPIEGTARLLWNHASGAASLWSLNADLSLNRSVEMGPFAGWTAVDLSIGGDNRTRLLWQHTDGRASVWLLAPDGRFLNGQEFGPFAGWTPIHLGVSGGDNRTRLLWRHADGRALVWFLRPDVSYETGPRLWPLPRLDTLEPGCERR
jgi:hypothetical protein